MKYSLLALTLLLFQSVNGEEFITPEKEVITYRGEYMQYIDTAFDAYLNQISDTKYKYTLLKENYTFNLTINGNAVIVQIFFNSKEFRVKTGKDLLGGGGEYVIAKDLGIIKSSKLYR